MNPYQQQQQQPLTPYEKRLRDEVIYLHSLWHRGPPILNPNPNFLRPIGHSHYSNDPSRNLHVSNSISFKKFKGNKHRNQIAKNRNPLPDPGPEWPVNPSPSPPPPSSTSGWPAFKDRQSPSTRTLPDIDEAKVATMQMQQKVVKSCNMFFVKKGDLGSEEDEEFEEEDGDDDGFSDDNEVEESEEFKFFFSLFVENRELRSFYEHNQETGDFYCLVCGGMGVKLGKMFKGCLGLVQHAIAILKTKRKRAHRAFGQVICRVLGWDISRLPVIVLKGEPLSQSLANLGETLNCLKEDNAKKAVEDLGDGVSGTEASKGEDMDYKEVIAEDDGNRVKELDDGVPDTGTSKERITECLNSLNEEDANKLDKKYVATDESGVLDIQATGTEVSNSLGENSCVNDLQEGINQ